MACGPEPGQHPQSRDTHCAWKACRAVVQSSTVPQLCTIVQICTDMYCTTAVQYSSVVQKHLGSCEEQQSFLSPLHASVPTSTCRVTFVTSLSLTGRTLMTSLDPENEVTWVSSPLTFQLISFLLKHCCV